GLQLVAAVAADVHRLALLGLGVLELHVSQRLLDRGEVGHLERALREVGHAYLFYVTARACVPRRRWSRRPCCPGGRLAHRSAPSSHPSWQVCAHALRLAGRAFAPIRASFRSALAW